MLPWTSLETDPSLATLHVTRTPRSWASSRATLAGRCHTIRAHIPLQHLDCCSDTEELHPMPLSPDGPSSANMALAIIDLVQQLTSTSKEKKQGEKPD
ncbi:MAG: hypothetical protein Q9169_004312 [Polycauliona sp. 2 TL-2023]